MTSYQEAVIATELARAEGRPVGVVMTLSTREDRIRVSEAVGAVQERRAQGHMLFTALDDVSAAHKVDRNLLWESYQFLTGYCKTGESR